MRLADTGYHPLAYQCKVLLDGIELFGCFTADEEERKAYCYAMDDNNKEVVTGAGPVEEIKTGVVEIIRPSDFF